MIFYFKLKTSEKDKKNVLCMRNFHKNSEQSKKITFFSALFTNGDKGRNFILVANIKLGR